MFHSYIHVCVTHIGLTLDVVSNFHGNTGVVHSLSEPADVSLSVVRAMPRGALMVALTLCVALGVTRLSTLSFLTPWSWRPRWSNDCATNIVAWKIRFFFVSWRIMFDCRF